ncbi:MAG: hypothetical protein ABSB42_07635 [Tepidisphaeraceae bacterium]|jgi:hypothetical protein
MDTLEQRVERLERSCRRWRLGFLVMVMAAVGAAGAAAAPGGLADAQFAHLTVQGLTIRSQPNGPFISASCDNDRASITLSSPTAPSVIALVARPESADLFLSRKGPKGIVSAAVSADQQSGFLDLRNADGKDKELEP